MNESNVGFLSDMTCCICHEKGKPYQIHHIDGNHDNNTVDNLAALCLLCHNDTQISGAFGRKLNKELVILYRDDWYKTVARKRTKNPGLISLNSQKIFKSDLKSLRLH